MYSRYTNVSLPRASVPDSVIATAPVSDAGGDSEVVLTRGERRRREIIDVALRLFAENGFQSTGLIAIAKEVGITHAGILHHFGTKIGLLEAVVHERDAFATLFERWFESRPGLEPLEHLVEFADIVIERPLVIQLISNLVVENLDDSAPLRRYFIDRDARVRALVAERLIAAQGDGLVRDTVSPEMMGRGLLAFTIGANAQWLVDRDDDVLRRLYEGYATILLDRILIQPDAN